MYFSFIDHICIVKTTYSNFLKEKKEKYTSTKPHSLKTNSAIILSKADFDK